MGLVNQSTFCLSGATRKLMEKLKDTLKSTCQWDWSQDNKDAFEALKKSVVIDCEKGIKRLTSHSETPLVIISDWSKQGSGFTLYEVTCDHPKTWDTRSDESNINILCCPNQWRLIMAGGQFNSETEEGYAPVEGELLGIASALHKTRYFVSGHPDVTVITDHKRILNLLQDRTRTINNKRLTNLRRKCDGFIFKTGYGRGIDNTADAISRIKGWSTDDPERLETVDDSRDIDDDSRTVSVVKPKIPEDSRRISVETCTIPDEADTISINATEISIISDLKDVILEVNKIDLTNKRELTNAPSAVLGSWHTIPDPQKLKVLITMYGRGGPNPDNQDFNISIEDFDKARNYLYSSKIEAAEDIDNADENRHAICKHPENKRAEEDSINLSIKLK